MADAKARHGEPTWISLGRCAVTIVERARPETKAEEDALLLAAFRGALERISRALGMPGSPDLVHQVPQGVERAMRQVEVLIRRIHEMEKAYLTTSYGRRNSVTPDRDVERSMDVDQERAMLCHKASFPIRIKHKEKPILLRPWAKPPDGRIVLLRFTVCICPEPRGPSRGVCGCCCNAIPDDIELLHLTLAEVVDPEVVEARRHA